MKTKYVFAASFMAVALVACRPLREFRFPASAEAPAEVPVRIPYGSLLPELPSASPFELLAPPARLAELPIPSPGSRFDIAAEFSWYEKNHVRVADSRFAGDSVKIYIDLLSLSLEPHSYPLPGAKLISPFAGRRKNHAGVDLKTFAGDTVRAVFNGVARMAKSYSGYGNVIVVRHYNGLETVYSHNSKHLVSQGAIVRAGQPIALVGRTGRATTEHLHFETRVNGRAFNPAMIFDLQKRELTGAILVCSIKDKKVEVSLMQRFPPLVASNE